MTSILGIDLGGTKIAGTRYDATHWAVLEERKIDTHAGKPFADVVTDILAFIKTLRKEDTTSIGIGVPGLIERPTGKILTLPNIPGAENFALQEYISTQTGLPTVVENDSNCFAIAEALQGAGKGHDIVIGITMGTGVGGGIVINGKLFHGSHGFAAEIGHMLLCPGKPPYETTDKRGDVEQFLSGSAMGKRCTAAKRPEDFLKGEVCAFLQPEVVQETAWLCASLTHLMDPSIIVFGGSAGQALKPHLSKIEQELPKWILPNAPMPKLAIAELKDAGTRGAALIGM
ncbi:MAG: ROK family protein [Candidatus Peregrinibacteria bacterium]